LRTDYVYCYRELQYGWAGFGLIEKYTWCKKVISMQVGDN